VRVCALLALRAYWLQDASADEALAIAARAGITPILGALRQLMQG
jgi:NAD(P)H-flavin reductase